MQFDDDNNYKNNNNQGTVGNGHDNIPCVAIIVSSDNYSSIVIF